MSLIYLASPYSHQDAAVRQERYWAAVRKAATLMKMGECVFSPIAHTHEIGLILGNAVSHEFWMVQDRAILKHCDRLMVLMLPGWELSKGVGEEIDIANKLGMPVTFETL